MDKQAAIGELLYLISNTQKAVLNTRKTWTRKYVKSIHLFLDTTEKLLFLLETDAPVTIESISFAFDVLEAKHLTVSKKALYFWKQERPLQNRVLSQKHKHVIKLMLEILYDIRQQLSLKSSMDKNKIWYMIHSFHNLALVFLYKRESLLFENLRFSPLSIEQGIEYAKMDIDFAYRGTPYPSSLAEL